MRSTVQPYSAARAAANTSVSASAIGTAVIPSDPKPKSAISDRKAPIMKMSPWAKLIMPMMP